MIKNASGSTILRCMKIHNATPENYRRMEEWLMEAIYTKTARTVHILNENIVRQNSHALPNRFVIANVMKYMK